MDDILGDFIWNYWGISLVVLEGIVYYLVLFSRVYEFVNFCFSVKSKKIIREMFDLVIFLLGFKNLFEVEYLDFKFCWL